MRSPLPADRHITYMCEYVRCGRPTCKKDRAEGHGPYWYAYWRQDSRLHKRYVGKTDNLPRGAALRLGVMQSQDFATQRPPSQAEAPHPPGATTDEAHDAQQSGFALRASQRHHQRPRPAERA